MPYQTFVHGPHNASQADLSGNTAADYGQYDRDGNLRIETWANHDYHLPAHGVAAGHSALAIFDGSRPVPMAHSLATGKGLVSNGTLGCDLIRVPAGRGFEPHTHPGDHLLIVVAGYGTITVGGQVYGTQAGQVYMVEGAEPHAVGAITDHVILAVGSPHKAVGATDRMAPVEYAAVAAEFGRLTCTICHFDATHPHLLHDLGCPHCPCRACAWGEIDRPTP